MFSQTTGDEYCHLQQRPEMGKKNLKKPHILSWFYSKINEIHNKKKISKQQNIILYLGEMSFAC